MRKDETSIITTTDLREHFQTQIDEAISTQKVSAAAETTHYLTNLLTSFVHAEMLFEHTPDGVQIKPLALLYADALQENHRASRYHAFRRLGDVALFIAGVFSESLNRKLVDVDYYIAMGGNAYSSLSDLAACNRHTKTFAAIFGELAKKFHEFVDVLSEVAEQSSLNRDTDILRLYEIWVRTGSQRAADKLRAAGIEPNNNAATLIAH